MEVIGNDTGSAFHPNTFNIQQTASSLNAKGTGEWLQESREHTFFAPDFLDAEVAPSTLHFVTTDRAQPRKEEGRDNNNNKK